MKRLLSWLLVLTMLVACLPMSVIPAFAVENDVDVNDWETDLDVDFWELQPGGSLANPKDLTTDLLNQGDFTAVVTVPAGKTMYLIASRVAGMEMTINDGEAVICGGNMMNPYAWTITNDGAEAAEYIIKVAFPAGSDMNPVVIEDMTWYNSEVSQAAGDFDGYFYTYTATETGTVTLYFDAVYDENGDLVENVGIRDIMVTNLNTYTQYSLLQDGVDNYGLELQIPVEAGQELIINTSWVEDAAGTMYPAATYSWSGNFTYPAGTEQNPIEIDWAWNDAGTEATATVTVPEGATQYFNGKPGMIMTIGGVETALAENGTFTLSAGTYELALATPVGAYNNPEVIENIDGYTSTQSLDAEANYNYVWTATEDGTVTLDITDGANITVNKVIEISEDGWPVTEQFELATVEYDDNWNASWVVAENLVIEVVAGQQLNIQVNGLTDWSTWSVPAIDYTLTGSFEKAVTGPVVDTKLNIAQTALSLKSGIIAQYILNKPAGFDSVKLVVERAGETIEVTNYQTQGSLIAFEVGFTARMMTEKATVTVYAEKDGQTYVGESLVDWTIKQKAIEMLDNYYPSYKPGSTDSKTTTCNLVANMLNYGAAAQNHFKYNTEDLATDGLKDEYLDLIITEAPEMAQKTIAKDNSGSLFVRKINSLSLGANIQLQIGYVLPVGVNLSDYHAVVVNKDRNTEYEHIALEASGSYAVLYFDGITAQQLRETLQITIYQGESAVSETFEISVENLAAGMLSKYPELIPAMMNYSDCAKARFGS